MKRKNPFDIWPVLQRPERAVGAAALSTCRRNTSSWGNSQFYQLGVSFTAQLVGHAVPCIQPVSVLLWASIHYQNPSRRAVLGRPLALQEALFWVSVLMLCCKCILFKGCTNYKLVLGDEDKNIFSQPVSVNNLWCYLEMWYSFHVAGNVCAVCEGLQQPQCRAYLWSGWQIKQGRNFLHAGDGKVDIHGILFHS